GDVTILDAATGVRQGRLQTDSTTSAVLNDQTDRLYLVSESGLLQCLREVGATKPLVHGAEVQPGEGDPAAGEEADPFAAPDEGEDPFAAPDDDPFGTDAPGEMPEEDAPGEDPFAPSTPPADDPFAPKEPPADEGDNPFPF